MLDKISAIKLEGAGDLNLLYHFRALIVAHIEKQITVQDFKAQKLEEDIETLFKFFSFFRDADWWREFKIKFPYPEEAATWICNNADLIIRNLEALERASNSFQKAAGLPDRVAIEKVKNKIEEISFEGSPKQSQWAKDIALKNATNIAKIAQNLGNENDIKLPTSASWWIDNRSEIYISLVNFQGK